MSDGESNDQSTDDSETQSEQQPTDSDRSSAQSDEQPADQTDQSTEQSEEQPAEGDQPAEQAEGQATDSDQSAQQSDTQTTEEAQQSAEQSGEKPADESEQPTGEPDQSGDQTREQAEAGSGGSEAAAEQPAGQSDDKPAAGSLSPARAKVINEILPEVMGAKYKHGSPEDQAKFNRLLPGIDIEAQRKTTPGYTTCGALPAYVLKRLGGVTDKGVLCGGLGGVRDGIPDKQGTYHGGAKALGAWVNHDGQNRPMPGDIYILEGPIHYTDKATGADKTSVGIRHIGIIVSTTKNSDGTEAWVTADAGQGIGVNQEADKQTRTYDPNDKTVTGKADKGTVVGWVDLDLLVSKSAGS